MAIFTRSPTPSEVVKHYREYLPLIRADFEECCAYCLLHELVAHGPENFEIDHFRPKANLEFAHLVNAYTNLAYACHVCNRYKGASWPSPELESNGYRFLDTCNDDFSTHFEDTDGLWTPLSRAGEYTEARLRLNRKHLVEIRTLLNQLATLRGEAPIEWGRPIRQQVISLFGER